jgi:hypothetical protein
MRLVSDPLRLGSAFANVRASRALFLRIGIESAENDDERRILGARRVHYVGQGAVRETDAEHAGPSSVRFHPGQR